MPAAAVIGTAGEERRRTATAGTSVRVGSEGNTVVPVTAIAGAGWLFLFVVLLIAPPSSGPHRGGGPDDGTRMSWPMG
jgi:hypothetical protein